MAHGCVDWAKPAIVAATLVAAVGCSRHEPSRIASSAPAAQVASSLEEILAASDLPPTQVEPIPGDPMNVTVHRLSNGMTVYLSVDHHEPRFEAWVVVRAGSRHDPADSTGLAHYLEHMLFKGTDEIGTIDIEKERIHLDKIAGLYQKLAGAAAGDRRRLLAEIDAENQLASRYSVPNEIDRLYTTLGIEGVNAFTSDDVTAYLADVPGNRLEAWAMVEGERFADPEFRLFLPELEAVYEEKNLALDSPWERVTEALLAGLFPRHPYGTQPTIGRVEHLKVPAYGPMVEYFHRWYAPNNMAIVLAGDVDPDAALVALERHFGRLPARRLPQAAVVDLAGPRGRTFREVVAEDEEVVTIAWRTVPANHDDEAALEVMDWLMDNAQTGLLNLELELTQKVPEAASWASFNNDGGHWALTATARHGQSLAEVENLLLGVVAKLRDGAFDQADIDAIVLHKQIDEQLRLESNDGRVEKMADSFVRRRSWADVLAHTRRLHEVRRQDVMDVARRYLGDDRVVVWRRKGAPELPKIVKPAITPLALDLTRESPFAARVRALPVAELEPEWINADRDYVRVGSPAGPLIAVENRRNALFSLTYRFEHGYRDDRLLCHALDLLELSGAGKITAAEVRRRFYALGTSVSLSCNAEQTAIHLSGIDSNLDASLVLLRKWLDAPTFDQTTVTRLLHNTLSRRKDHLQSPQLLSRALTDFANFGPKSAWREHPTNRDLAGAKPARLRAIIRTAANRRHRTLYFGPRSAAAAAAVVSLGSRHAKARPPRPRRYRQASGTTIWFLHRDVAKAEIDILWPRPRLARENRPLSRLYSEYLGGNMSSLVFQEIREARGLAYTARAYHTAGRTVDDDSGLVGRMATQSDKTVDALQTFLELVGGRTIDRDRVRSARASLDQGYRSNRVDPRHVVHLVDEWDVLGERNDPRPEEWEAVRTLEPADLQVFADGFASGTVIVSIMGNRQNIDLDALRRLAPVIEVQPDALFSYGPFPADDDPAQTGKRP